MLTIYHRGYEQKTITQLWIERYSKKYILMLKFL